MDRIWLSNEKKTLVVQVVITSDKSMVLFPLEGTPVDPIFTSGFVDLLLLWFINTFPSVRWWSIVTLWIFHQSVILFPKLKGSFCVFYDETIQRLWCLLEYTGGYIFSGKLRRGHLKWWWKARESIENPLEFRFRTLGIIVICPDGCFRKKWVFLPNHRFQ